MSIASSSAWAPAAIPSLPKVTASTSGVLVTMVTTMSERSATSRGLRTTVAPASASGVARSGVRFVTVTGKPPLSALRAMGAPMIPRPTKPTRSMLVLVVFFVRVVAREEDGAVALILAHEERAFFGLVDVHRCHEEIVGHVDEPVRARELVRDRFGQRIFLERVDEQRSRLLHEREELEGIELPLMRDEDRGAELFIALMDLVEEHAICEGTPLDSEHLHSGFRQVCPRVGPPHGPARSRLARHARGHRRRGSSRAESRRGVRSARAAGENPGIPAGQGPSRDVRARVWQGAPLGGS